MAFKLPPLGALRAFEAAARHTSFTRAATELFVTPGAISRQISGLEEYIGFALFERTNREVKLTPAGQVYARQMTEAFTQIAQATHEIQASETQRVLRLSVPLTFALRWLMPRLNGFKTLYPDNEYRITTVVPVPLKLATADFDAGIRIFKKSTADLIVHRLLDIEYVPVCSPKLLKTGKPLNQPEDLRHHVLLHSSARPNDWALWLGKAQLADLNLASGLHFESSSVAYEAALEGMGVAIAMKALVADHLASGRLVMPIDLTYSDGSAFCFVYPRKPDVNKSLATFRDWIVDEAGMPLPAQEL